MIRAYGRFVGKHPWVVLLLLAAITVGMVQGMRVRHEAPPSLTIEAFLPPDNPLALARERLAADFPLQAGRPAAHARPQVTTGRLCRDEPSCGRACAGPGLAEALHPQVEGLVPRGDLARRPSRHAAGMPHRRFRRPVGLAPTLASAVPTWREAERRSSAEA